MIGRTRDTIAGRPVTALVALTALVSLIFLAFPGLDLAASRLFYHDGVGFALARDPWLGALRELGNRLSAAAVAVAALGVVVPLIIRRRFGPRPANSLYALAVYAVGPGLIVNGVFKEAFGRARPREIVEFGGDAAFSGPWLLSDACRANCSFVGGEAASAIALVAFAVMAPPAFRRHALAAALALAAAVSLNRVAFGGHFLSDVLIAWLVVFVVTAALRPLFAGPRGEALDRALTETIPEGAAAHIWRPLGRRLGLS